MNEPCRFKRMTGLASMSIRSPLPATRLDKSAKFVSVPLTFQLPTSLTGESTGLFSGGYVGRGLSQAEVDALTAEFRSGGGVIDQSVEAQRYLQLRGAGGLTLNESTILLPAAPTRTAVMEELIHAQQFANGASFGSSGALEMEAEAAETLINNRIAYQLPNDEVRPVVNNLRNIRTALGQ